MYGKVVVRSPSGAHGPCAVRPKGGAGWGSASRPDRCRGCRVTGIPTAIARAEAVIPLSTEQGFMLWLAAGTVARGWALAEQGQGETGIAQIRQGLAAWQATGTAVAQPWVLAVLAEAYGKVGQTEEGLRVLTEALTVVDKIGEGQYAAEIYRLKGVLTLSQLF